MSLNGRMKTFVNTHVNLNDPALEPASTPFGQLRRFWQLDHIQDTSVEVSSCLFSAFRHRKLDVIDGSE